MISKEKELKLTKDNCMLHIDSCCLWRTNRSVSQCLVTENEKCIGAKSTKKGQM